MFSLTREERQVVLFLITAMLIGLGINLALKSNDRIKSMITADINIARININRVSYEDLWQSQLVSAKLAKKIIEYRSAHGPFKNLEELKDVKGIGDYRYEKLKDLFFVE